MIRLLFLIISFSSQISASEKLDLNEYIIKSGDTLWSISREFNIPINNIIEINDFKSYVSGIPILQINQKIKLYRSKEDDLRDYCYSYLTYEGINFSKKLLKNEIIRNCVFALNKELDTSIVGSIDEKTLYINWNGNKLLEPNKDFWDIYFSDIRYSYYFFNLQFLEVPENLIEDHRNNIQQLLLDASLKGDALNADYVLDNAKWFFNNKEHNFNNLSDFTNQILSNLDEASLYFITNTSVWDKYPEYGIVRRSKPEELIFESNERYLSKYFFNEISESYTQGDKRYYQTRDDAIKYIRNSNSKLLSWYDIALVVNIMYQSMNLDDHELSEEVSSILESRLDFDLDEYREIEIYNRFINNVYYEDEYNNLSLILTWILNLTSTLDRLYPGEEFDYLIERREYFLEFVNMGHRNNLLNDIELSNWYGDIGSLIVDHYGKCSEAESYFRTAFDIFESLPKERKLMDAYSEPLDLARCFIENKNVEKAKIYLELSSDNAIEINDSDTLFYLPYIDLLKARIYSLQNDPASAYQYMDRSSTNMFNDIDKLSHTLNPSLISDYIDDYIDLYSYLETLGFDLSQQKSFLEFEALKNKIISNRRLDQIKIDSTKKNISLLKDELKNNEKLINKYEEMVAIDFDESNIAFLENLYSDRTKIMNNMLRKNKSLNSLFNPSLNDYKETTKKLDNESVVLYYNLTFSGGNIVLQSKDETHLIELTEGKGFINKNIRTLRASLEDLNSNYPFEAAHELYVSLFKPLEKYLVNKKNIYIYGSELENLPFGILVNNFNELNQIENYNVKLLSAGWLIKEYSFARIYPLSNKNLNQEYDHKFLGLANPNSISELNLPELNNSEDEIIQIGLSSQSFSRDFILTRENASKKNLIKMLSNSYERLVFSTHSVPPYWKGVTNEGALVLADSEGDYLLTSTEIVDLDIRSDMVVLSSCSTKEKGSDSIYKSFLVAGANSVMFTNWDLETISASVITDKVFKYMLFESDAKHIALQKASLELMNDYSNPMYAHPAFWGNFSIAYRSL